MKASSLTVEFDLESGTHSGTEFVSGGLQLTGNGGNYISPTINTEILQLNNLEWTPERAQGKPIIAGTEVSYTLNLNISNRVGLWSMSDTLDRQNGYNLTEQNGITTTTGHLNNAYSFSGTDEYLSRTLTGSFGASEGEVSAMVRATTSTGSQVVLTITESSGYSNNIQLGIQNLTPFIYSRVNGGTENLLVADEPITLNEWSVITWGADSGGYYIAIDGELVALNIILGADTGDWLVDIENVDQLLIGAVERGGTLENFWDGYIDEVMVNNSNSTTSTLQMIYERWTSAINMEYRMCDDEMCSGENWEDTEWEAWHYSTRLPEWNLGFATSTFMQIRVSMSRTDGTNYNPRLLQARVEGTLYGVGTASLANFLTRYYNTLWLIPSAMMALILIISLYRFLHRLKTNL